MIRRHRSTALWLFALTLLPMNAVAADGGPSVHALGPGESETVPVVAAPCPTFHWGGPRAGDPHAFDLRVSRVVGTGEVLELQTVLDRRIPGQARLWTPYVGECLEPGGVYAWRVRPAAANEQAGEWSRTRYFQVQGRSGAAAELPTNPVDAGLGGKRPSDRAEADPASREKPAGGGDEPHTTLRPASLVGAAVSVHGKRSETSGNAIGVVGESASPGGAGVAAANAAPGGGPDLLLDGTAQAVADTILTESGLDRVSPSPQTFDVGNSAGGGMSLLVDGALVFTAGNDGDGSGLDADLLDGMDSSDFTAAGTDLWLDETGDTLHGPLTLWTRVGFDLVGGGFFLHRTGFRNAAVGAEALEGVNSSPPPAGGTDNSALGYRALTATTSGDFNTAVGSEALEANLTGRGNTAVGTQALQRNDDSMSTAVGWRALFSSTSSRDNTAIGAYALRKNTVNGITALGTNALENNTTGLANTAVGFKALTSNTTAQQNTAVGRYALRFMNGHSNTAVGNNALRGSFSNPIGNGGGNTAVGSNALGVNYTGGGNTALGASAMTTNETGSNNTAVGILALRNAEASYNTAVGSFALRYTTSGAENTAVGHEALRSNTTGTLNTAVGSGALSDNEIGVRNTAVGQEALLSNTTGLSNTAVGEDALKSNTSGGSNTAVGHDALLNSTGSRNTAVGADALDSVTTGTDNIALGEDAGQAITSGSRNIAIGNDGTSGDTDTIRIGATHTAAYLAGVNGQTAAGGSPVYVNGDGKLGTSTSSRRLKEDIRGIGHLSEAIHRLRPVAFRYRPEVAGTERPPQEYGLIAEEVAEVLSDLVSRDSEGHPAVVRYHLLVPLLLAELQREHEAVQALGERLAREEERAAEQARRLGEQGAMLRELRERLEAR